MSWRNDKTVYVLLRLPYVLRSYKISCSFVCHLQYLSKPLFYFQDNAIVVWFSNRAGSVDTFAGTSAISFEVQCNDLPSGGVDRTAVNNLAAK